MKVTAHGYNLARAMKRNNAVEYPYRRTIARGLQYIIIIIIHIVNITIGITCFLVKKAQIQLLSARKFQSNLLVAARAHSMA